MLQRKLMIVFLLSALLIPSFVFGQAAVYTAPPEVIAKIKDEGLNRSEIMPTLSYLIDVIGPRLTNSPNMKRANEWTRDTMAKWGLQNAKLEAWGPFGRGWSLKGFSAQIVDPQYSPVIAFPKAWSPSTQGTINAEVVHLDVKTIEDFDKYKGQLKGKIILVSNTRELEADFNGMGTRRSDESLAEMEKPAPAPAQMTEEQRQRMMQIQAMNTRRMSFLLEEGVAVVVDNSAKGSGGTLFVSGAAVSQPVSNAPAAPGSQLRVYQKEAESRTIPQMVMATEDYNRLVRMIQKGVKPKMSVNIQVQFHDEDLMGYNTTAEIPGTDPKLKDEIVMLGGHLDSWHSAGGATDNAAGVAVAMEAVRIIQALGLKPRRTIRVGLWSGEEQGLNGSREYVKQQFGEMQGGGNMFGPPNPNAPRPTLVKGKDYDKFSVYYNLDNGTGAIRGVYLQGNSAVAPIFRQWLVPFAEFGAKTITPQNTGGTDHLSFDRIGLPGFQFIQDEVEYSTRTHHSNQDFYDRIQADDVKKAAIIMAAFVYQSAMMDEKMPRKPMN